MPGTVTEIQPGLWRIRLPFNFELNHINVHLLRLEKGYLLVDCGIGTEACFAALESALAALGVEWTEIKVVVLTHCHPDHVGLAPRVLELSRARALMHAVEIRHLHSVADWADHPEAMDGKLIEWGVPEDRIHEITKAFVNVRRSFQRLEKVEALGGGEVLYTGIGPLETVWTPGHSPGHLCLYASRDQLLLSGDHVLPSITPNIAWMPEADSLADYLRALDQVSTLKVKTVLPSHGDPFTDLAGRTRETVAHHESRCGQILRVVAEEGHTPHEIAGHLWRNTLSPFQQRFALFEVMAHMVYLERRGQVVHELLGGVGHWSCVQHGTFPSAGAYQMRRMVP
ncbi:MAG: MBL fold metallo-hydrolase [Acidobacteriia bacterium]|nr:MBL fold metallo-hydrolase [Terriglobia bacterium]